MLRDADTLLRMPPGLRRPASAPLLTPAPTFHALYTREFGFVWRCLRALGVPTASLDDAAQEVFVVVHRRLHEFRGDANVRTWLYGIVRNIAANARRTQRRKGGLEPLDERAPGHERDPGQCAEDRELALFVAAFVARLDDKKRDVFVLALLEELTVPEVAESLQIPLNTAYTRLRTVRREFREAIERKRARP